MTYKTRLDPLQVLNATPKSVLLNRPFASPTWDDNAQELQKSLESAKEALPEVAESAYKPSGQISPLARLVMVLAMPFITLLVVVVIRLILLGYDYFVYFCLHGSIYIRYGIRGFVSILVDGIIAVVMFIVVPWLYARLCRLLKIRNMRWPGILTLVTSFIVAIIFFWPIWENGSTLAPTELFLLGFVPLKWVIVVSGGLVLPMISYWVAAALVGEQKFCEVSGVFLRPVRKIAFPLIWAENVLELLASKNYEQIRNVPRTSAEHRGELVLWCHEKAETAYLEMTIFFTGKARTKTEQEQREIKKNWLAFSERLSSSEAEQFKVLLQD